jgi:glucose 1-dehydrogenase
VGNSLQQKTVLVTGASSGIGQAIAIAFANSGANVCINFYKDLEGAKETEQKIKNIKGQCIIIQGDISKEEDVIQMFGQLIDKFGNIHILVNNAGIQMDSPVEKMTLEKWQRVIDINLTGHFLCSREAIKQFLKNEIPDSVNGKIIFISSVHDTIPWAGHCNYAASKGGIDMLMKTLALELAPKKIRVNNISPGAIQTPINKSAWSTPEALQNLLKLIPYGRIGTPEDIAKVAVWLAGDDSDYITGTTIYVDGGMTLYPGFAHGG